MKRVFISIAYILSLTACMPNYSNGTRVGVITKLSEKGVVFRSWEGELLMALPDGVNAINAEKFRFTVEPDAVAEVQAALRSGTRVEVSYHQWWIHPPNMDTAYGVTRVAPAE